MSVQSRIDAGYLARVGWYLDHGLDSAEFAQHFGTLGPGENYLTINAVWRAGLLAHYAGQLATTPGTVGTVRNSDIPGGGGGRTNYRYTIQYTYTDQAGTEVLVRTHHETRANQMSRADMDAIGVQLTPRAGFQSLGVGLNQTTIQTFALTATEVVSLERSE